MLRWTFNVIQEKKQINDQICLVWSVQATNAQGNAYVHQDSSRDPLSAKNWARMMQNYADNNQDWSPDGQWTNKPITEVSDDQFADYP